MNTVWKSTIVAIVLAASAILLPGCGSQTTTRRPSTSTAELVKQLPPLADFEFESCDFTVETTTVSVGVPSPADTRVQILGSATLTAAGAEALKTAFDWRPVSPGSLPHALVGIVPAGELLVSPRLNRSFAEHTTFVHGFVATPTNDQYQQVFFVAMDEDHPLQ